MRALLALLIVAAALTFGACNSTTSSETPTIAPVPTTPEASPVTPEVSTSPAPSAS